jgi:hypothetical protein
MKNGICIALGNVTQVVRTQSPLAQVRNLGAVKNTLHRRFGNLGPCRLRRVPFPLG